MGEVDVDRGLIGQGDGGDVVLMPVEVGLGFVPVERKVFVVEAMDPLH